MTKEISNKIAFKCSKIGIVAAAFLISHFKSTLSLYAKIRMVPNF